MTTEKLAILASSNFLGWHNFFGRPDVIKQLSQDIPSEQVLHEGLQA